MDYDFMIITVESDFKYNNFIQPIKLDAASTDNSFKGDCKISGYGYTQEWFKNNERRFGFTLCYNRQLSFFISDEWIQIAKKYFEWLFTENPGRNMKR